jgi:NADPH:quinone reductase-like Zn-dependent oxidoreductase
MKNCFPEKMQAVFLTEEGNQLITRFVPVPKPGPGEVLVKIAAAPINPSDLARIRNIADPAERTTFIPGIEGSGTVVESGPGLIPRLWKGRRVACTTSHGHGGTWAEFMLTRAMSCIPLPDAMTFEQGSMLLVNPLTAVAFFNMIKAGGHKAIINTAAASSLGRMIDILGKKSHIRVIHVIRNEKQKTFLEQVFVL